MLCADSEYAVLADSISVTPAEIIPLRGWRPDVPFDPSAPTAGEPLEVYGNHGRWIVECPCKGAQLASRTDLRFMCVDCGNAYQGGAWRPITWPADVDQIADLLDQRPTVLANFDPGQTVEDIQAENDTLAAVADAFASDETEPTA
jgi:hypothetical protein